MRKLKYVKFFENFQERNHLMSELKYVKSFEGFDEKNDIDQFYLNLFKKTKKIGGFKDKDNNPLGNKFDAIPTGLFITSIFEKYLKGSKFIDIGCGLGNVVRLAEKFGMNSTGIEIQTKYKVYHKDISVVYEDAKKFNYSNLDVIYMYRPMVKDKDMYGNDGIMNCNNFYIRIYYHYSFNNIFKN